MRYFILLCGVLFLTSCTSRIYETAEIETLAEKHTTIAIIQPKVDYKFERPDHRNWSFVPAKEDISAGVQLALSTWIEANKDRGRLDIKVLDIETTNKRLAGTTTTTDYSEIAGVLGVDAVLVSRLNYDTSFDYKNWLYYMNDQSPQSRIYLNLFTPEEGLIWSYERGGPHPNNNYHRIVFDLLQFAVREMPYAVAK